MARTAWLLLGLVVVFVAAVAAGLSLRQSSRTVSQAGEAGTDIVEAARRAWDSGNYLEVVRLMRQVPDTNPHGAQARFLEGQALWKLDYWQAAEDLWKRAIELDPQLPEVGWHLLRFYFVYQRLREAEELALEMYAIEPDPRDRTLLLLELVRLEHERLTFGETAQRLEPVVTLERDNHHALSMLGRCYVEGMRIHEGLALVERAVAVNPADIEAWFNLVWCLDKTGRIERLGQVWDEIPPAAMEESRFLRYRGTWAEAVGDRSEAERAYRATLARDPADRKAHYQLAQLLRNRGEEQEAAEHEEEARRLHDAREKLATYYTEAVRQKYDASLELCRQFSRLWRLLGRTRQAECWDREAERRSAVPNPPGASDVKPPGDER